MFERYTEKARRVIFFARYEASQFGSPFIETEHLLLGIFRDDKELIRRVLLKLDIDSARQEIVSRTETHNQQLTSVDLPLSDHAKHALIYAAEEADRLNHRNIGTQHLLLGLVRDEQFSSAKILSRFGAKLETLRKQVEALGNPIPLLRSYVAAPRCPPAPPATVEIHGVKRNVDLIQISVSRCKKYAWHWEQKTWKARDIVIKKDGKGFWFDLALAENSTEFTLVKGGWKKDHCTICRWALFKSEAVSHGAGFTNGKDWVCTECYKKFIAGNFFEPSYSDIT
jgi:hypothetical protein